MTGKEDQRVPFVDLALSHAEIRNDLHQAFTRLLGTAEFSGGAEVEAFEVALARQLGVEHVVGVASGTSALHLALSAAEVGEGDEVILPANTFFATVEAVVAAGAIPVFADVERSTALLDPDGAAACVSSRTAAVIAVHLYGQTADIDRLATLTRRHGLLLIEDAAQALGATWRGRPAGALGDAAALSFYPTKNLGALGEAGAVATNNHELASRVSMLRNHGQRTKDVHEAMGRNDRLDGLQAAFLRAKLVHLEEAQRRRLEAAGRYADVLSDFEDVTLLELRPEASHAYHLFVVRVPRRDAVLARMQALGVDARVHYPTPVHLQPACARLPRPRTPLSVAREMAASVLSLPLFPGITLDQQHHVAGSLAQALADTC